MADREMTYDELLKANLCQTCEHFTGDRHLAKEYGTDEASLWECEVYEEAFYGKGAIYTFLRPYKNDDSMISVTFCSCFKPISYKHYIDSEMWKQKRIKRIKNDGYKCQLCGSAMNLQVHHITYENVPFEKDDDLLTVCKSCHQKLHEKDLERKNNG